MRNNLIRSFYIIVFLLSQALSAQQNYILHFKYKVSTYSAVSPGCSVYFGTENNRTANYIFGYEVIYNLDEWLDYMVKVDGNTTYGIYVKDCDGNINRVQGLFVPKENLSSGITQDYYYTSTYKSESYSFGFTDSILFYQPIQLDQIGTSDPTECIADSCQSIPFQLTIKNPSAISGVIITAKDVYGNLIGSKLISGNSSTVNVRFCDLNLYSPDYFGQPIQFAAEGKYCANLYCLTMGGNIKYKSFFQQLPNPISIKLNRTSCGGDTLKILADPIYLRFINTLKFRAKPSDTAETTSNIVALKVLNTSGNYIYLTENLQSGLVGFSDKMRFYDLQVFNNSYSDSVKSGDITCGVMKTFLIDSVPARLKLTGYPSTYSFLDSSSSTTFSYNISKYGANDAAAYLTVGDESKIKKWQYSMDGGIRWWDASAGIHHTGYNKYTFTPMYLGGWYAFRIIDIKDCLSQMKGFNQQITGPDKLEIKNMSVSPVSCNRNDKVDDISLWKDGMINLSWSGGCGPYGVILYDSIGTFIKSYGIIYRFNKQINNLSPGRYRVFLGAHVMDDSLSFIVNVPSNDDIKLTTLTKNVDCFGNSNGEITLSVSNNDSVFEYNIFKNDTSIFKNALKQKSMTFSTLFPAKYMMKVSNLNQCYETTPNFIITQPDKINISAIPKKIARYGTSTGTISVTMNGGIGPYSMTFKDSIINTSAQSIFYSNLKAGIYKVLLADANGCKDSIEDIQVLQPLSALTFKYNQTNVDCFGNSTGSVTINATGGWSPYKYGMNGIVKGANSTIANLPYSMVPDSIFVIDSMNVKETLPVSILQPELPLTAGIKKITQPLCYGDKNGKVELSFNGGTKPYYFWNGTDWDSTNIINNLGAEKNLKIDAKDKNNCTANISVNIDQPTPVTASKVSIKDATCNNADGAIIASAAGGTVSGGYNYLWYNTNDSIDITNPAPELNNIHSGSYIFTASDDHGCNDTLHLIVADSDGPKVESYTTDSISCNASEDGGLNLTSVTGGHPAYTYFIDNRLFSGDTTGLSVGNYQIRVEDIQDCKTGFEFALTQPDPVSIHSVIKNPTCEGYADGTISLYPSGGNGGFKFKWNIPDSTGILTGLTKGIYDATVIDRKDCFAKKKFELTDPLPPKTSWLTREAILCEGNMKTLDAGNFSSYCWYKNADTISHGRKVAVYQSGMYYLRLKDDNGCSGLDSFKLAVSEHPLDAVILMSDSAAVGEPVTAIDVTWPVPDSIQWIFDSEVSSISSNEWSQDFTFSHEGIVKVTLRAWYGGCYSDSTKSVQFKGIGGDIQKSGKLNLPLIEDCIIFPNPNTGIFTLKVKLSRKADITLTTYNSGHTIVLNNRRDLDAQEYEESYNISQYSPGIYLIVVRAEDEQRILKVVIE